MMASSVLSLVTDYRLLTCDGVVTSYTSVLTVSTGYIIDADEA